MAWQKRHMLHERSPRLLRSYNHPKASGESPFERDPGPADPYPIYKIGRATSAAPFYFKAVELDEGRPELELIDGGFGANNPTELAYHEVMQMGKARTVKFLAVQLHR